MNYYWKLNLKHLLLEHFSKYFSLYSIRICIFILLMMQFLMYISYCYKFKAVPQGLVLGSSLFRMFTLKIYLNVLNWHRQLWRFVKEQSFGVFDQIRGTFICTSIHLIQRVFHHETVSILQVEVAKCFCLSARYNMFVFFFQYVYLIKYVFVFRVHQNAPSWMVLQPRL